MAFNVIRFGPFELNIGAYTLTVNGRAVHLERLPMDLLILLARESGRLVGREEIIERLWGRETFIDVDNAINTAIRKIRRTLVEDPEHPNYLETVVGKGYRLKTGESSGQDAQRVHIAQDDSRAMLAVLPFENLSADPARDYFGDGLTEETITCLGQLSPQRLGVIARTTSMAYRGTDKTIARIGAELGVDYLLEGSVRYSDDQVRISAQLIRVHDQSHLWAQSYDRHPQRLLDLQAEIAAAIVDQVQLKVGAADRHQLMAGFPDRNDAHDAYLRGLYHQAKVTRAELNKAIECFRRATEYDTTYAAAYSALAHCFIRLPITSDVESRDAFPKARKAIDHALRLELNSAQAYTADASTKFWFEWDFAGAQAAARRAIELNRNYAPAHVCLAHVCSNLGDHAVALNGVRRALALDPLALLINAMYGQFLYHAGKDAEALDQFESTLELESRFWVAHVCMAKVHERLGRYAEALESCEKAFAYSDGNTEAQSLAGYTHAVAGERTLARQKIDELIERATHTYVPPYNIALIYAGLDDTNTALHWLARAFADRDVHMVFLRDHKWDRMRELPEFHELMKRVGLPE